MFIALVFAYECHTPADPEVPKQAFILFVKVAIGTF
jgi:hypothetical protein